MTWRFGPETTIVIGAGAARPVERAAAYLQTAIERRTGMRWRIATGGDAAPGSIVLGIPDDGAPVAPLMPEHPEEIALWCGGDPAAPTAYALAGGPSVALAAAGRLARTFDLRPGVAALSALSLRNHPAFPIRGHMFANHKQNNTHDKWEYADWEEYLTELAAWGNNIAVCYPLHAERWHGVLPFDDPPWFATPDHEAEWHRQWAIQQRLPDLCHELGMRYGIWNPVNDLFEEEARQHPEATRYGGAYACAHTPEGRRRIRALRDRLFAALPHLDVLVLPSRDDGGCPNCPDCEPWAHTYLELVQEQAAQARAYHPECRVWTSLQGLDPAEAQYILDWLDRDRPEWVEAVSIGPYSELMTHGGPGGPGGVLSLQPYGYGGPISGPIHRLRAAVPGRYRVAMYPDITHTFRCQHPVVGMDPAVQVVWDRENGPLPRPREMTATHAATAPASDGSATYTEGDTDDVNKFVWSARDWDPARTGEDVTAEYARWFFGPAAAPAATEAILLIEEALNAPLYGSAAVPTTVARVRACEAADAALLENWRWLSVRLAALMLDHIQRVLVRDRDLAATLRYRVPTGSNFDAAPFIRAGIPHIERRFAETEGLLREIVWTRDRIFALHKLAVRGVANMQDSYMHLDVLVREWKEIVARLDRGELADPAERRAAITGAMRGFEERLRDAARGGIPLADHIQEYAWETGATTWK